MDEAGLVSRAQKGDLASFNCLVEASQSRVYNLCLRMLGDSAQAEDVTQESFLAAYRSIGGFRGGDFRVWMLRIAANRCRDELRKRKRHPTTSLDAFMVEPDSSPSLLRDGDGPEDAAVRRELGERLLAGLAGLPEDQRLAVILSDIQGFGYEDIAKVMGASLGTVKSRISRGRAHMRQYLLAQGELLPSRYRHINA